MRFLKPFAVTVILTILLSSPASAQTSFFVPEFWRSYILFHVLPLTAFMLSYLWGKKYLAARIVAYGLCFTAGVTYFTINRTENNKHLTTPKQ